VLTLAFAYNKGLMRCFVVAVASVLVVCAQQPAPLAPDVLQLNSIRHRMMENLARQPDYTCVETIERSQRIAANRRFDLIDMLRLEVALVAGKEMFGWPGDSRFEDMDLRSIVSTGVIGNGNFALHARAIFGNEAVAFQSAGSDPDGLRYDFQVPQTSSIYKIRARGRAAVVAYHGSVWTDPESLDVRRIDVIADSIPAELGLAASTDRMEYAPTGIGSQTFLLPASSELKMIDAGGAEKRNRVRFSGCRQFAGESMLSFDDAPPVETPHAVSEIELPGDLRMRLTLLDEVDLTKSAIGDPVRARLENDLRHQGKLLFAHGATVLGRITRMERRGEITEIGLQFSEIRSASLRARLRARLEEVVGLNANVPPLRPAGFSPARPGEGIIPLSSMRTRVLRGILMFWRT
jgi:hypothetical protein